MPIVCLIRFFFFVETLFEKSFAFLVISFSIAFIYLLYRYYEESFKSFKVELFRKAYEIRRIAKSESKLNHLKIDFMFNLKNFKLKWSSFKFAKSYQATALIWHIDSLLLYYLKISLLKLTYRNVDDCKLTLIKHIVDCGCNAVN